MTLSMDWLYDDLSDRVFRSLDPDSEGIGLEIEYFLMRESVSGSQRPQLERNSSEAGMGLYPFLLLVADRHEWKTAPVESAAALAFFNECGGKISLEPGGQIEYSTAVHETVEDAEADVEGFHQVLQIEAERHGFRVNTLGFNDRVAVDDAQLVVPKPRYLLMDQHFAEIGTWGRQMMRLTGATQINLDFGDDETARLRWRVANVVAPALNALFAGSEHEEDGISSKSYRYEIWKRTDPSRTGIPIGFVDGGDPVEAYLEFALDATVLMVENPRMEGDFVRAPGGFRFREWLGSDSGKIGRQPVERDWDLHLSTLFPDVRPRGFIEIRSLDALPATIRSVAVKVVTALLYRRDILASFSDGLDDEFVARARPESSFDDRFDAGVSVFRHVLASGMTDDVVTYGKTVVDEGLTPADLVRETA